MLTGLTRTATVLPMSPSDAHLSHRDRQRLETREKLFALAVDEIAASGIDRADVRRIAEAADVARGTFYFHFPAKADVLLELQRREIDRIVDGLEAAQDAGVSDVLDRVVTEVLASERRLGASLFRDMVSVNFGRATSTAEQVETNRLVEYVAGAATAAQTAGSLREDVDPVEFAAIALIGLFGLLAASRGPSAGRDQLAQRYVDTVLRGSR